MPFPFARRQAGPDANRWFQRSDVVRLVEAAQRQAIPELMRVFGHDGLYLRPSDAVPALLSGNLLANVLSLYRQAGGWSGDLRCSDEALPLLSSSQSLVYASFVAETSPQPEALVAEIARVLRPEGTLMLLTLNPWSPLRIRGGWGSVTVRGAREWAARLRDAGLQIDRQTRLGPIWSMPAEADAGQSGTLFSQWRMACLTIARRREAGITPLRWSTPALGRWAQDAS